MASTSLNNAGTQALLTGNAGSWVDLLIRAADFKGILGCPRPHPGFFHTLVELFAVEEIPAQTLFVPI